MLVSLGLDQHIEDLAFGVDSPPKVDHSAVDFQIDLVEMPSRMRLQATLSQVGGDHRSEMVHPTPNRLVGHRHSAFRQQIFDVAQAEGEPEVKPYRLLNDLRRETIPVVADLVHPRGAIGTRCFATTRQGYRQILAWMGAFGDLQGVGVESTGSYGAGLLQFMQQAGIAVLEVTTPSRIAADVARTTVSMLRTRPMPPLQASGP